MTDKSGPITPGATPASGSPTTAPNTSTPNAANKAGDTKTTSKEYVKRETGKQDVPHVPQENTGHTSPNPDDLEHPEQKVDQKRDKDAKKGS